MEKAAAANSTVIDGASAFLLYDTYGFPLDLTQDIARENDMTVDEDGFAAEMAKQQERARAAGKFAQQAQISADAVQGLKPTRFLGYEHQAADECRVEAILLDGKPVDALEPGTEGIVLLDRTPFYAESGGQVGDTGRLASTSAYFEVDDTIKLAGVYHAHLGAVREGVLKVGDTVEAAIDADRRQAIVLHHSATHLMHAALKTVLGEHVEQRGSLVAQDHLRFDFTHPKGLSDLELAEVERLVNQEIRANPDSEVDVMAFDDALQTGATALFGEKYGDRVRVVRFGDFSVELCGGTHVRRVGDIGQFKIVEESAIAAGIRRIVAVAGEAAVDRVQTIDSQLKDLARVLKVAPDALEIRLNQLIDRSRALEKEVEELKSRVASASGDELAGQAQEVNGIKVLSARLDDVEPKALRDTVDRLKDKLGSSVVVIGSSGDGKVRMAAGVSKDLLARIQAGNLVNFVAQQVGGRGGGRPDFAQAGGSQPENLDGALRSVQQWVAENS
jgi:alanyl-tRNA synthetase